MFNRGEICAVFVRDVLFYDSHQPISEFSKKNKSHFRIFALKRGLHNVISRAISHIMNVWFKKVVGDVKSFR